MRRLLIREAMLLGVVLVWSVPSPAAPPNKNATSTDGVVAGTIKTVDTSGKSITIEIPAAGKKQPARTMQIKITDMTKIEYVGIDKEEDQKLKVGYTVAITLDEKARDTAEEMRVSNKPLGKPKKKKKNQ